MPVNSTHLDYEASAPERSRARRIGGIKRFAQTIFSRVFRATPSAFACIRKGFVGQAVRRKTRASVSRMSGPSTINPQQDSAPFPPGSSKSTSTTGRCERARNTIRIRFWYGKGKEKVKFSRGPDVLVRSTTKFGKEKVK
jgi:hypothetical protein